MLDLLSMWKGPLLNEERAKLPEKPTSYSDGIMQSSFTLPEGVKVVFVNSKETLEPVKKYVDLKNVELTEAEQTIVTKASEDLLKQPPPNNYDGDHLLISAVLYNSESKTLYLEAKKAKYSLVSNLNIRKFGADSPVLQQDLYGIGVLVPLITQDGFSVLLQANKYDKTNYAAVGGFVQAKDNNTFLLQNNGASLIEQAAHEELHEELLADENLQARLSFDQLQISSISFRKGREGRGFVEFYVPAKLHCKKEFLTQIIKTNVAPDSHEHTGNYRLIDLNPETRHIDDYSGWAEKTPGGRDLYPRAVSEASRLYTREFCGDMTQRVMPGSRGIAFPITFFIPNLTADRPLLLKVQEAEADIDSRKKTVAIHTDYIPLKIR